MEHLGQFAQHLEPLVRDYGVAAIAVILALEALGAPLPGETMLIFAGVLASRGEISLPGVAIAAWVGAVMGDNAGYLIGRKLGRAAVARFGAKVGLTSERFAKVEAVFARYGGATVTFARFFSVLRQLNGIVAGTLGMDWRRFLAFNSIGAALWVAVWVFGPYYLGEHIETITALAHHAGRAGVAGAVLLLVAVLAALWFWRGKRQADGA